MILGIGTDLCNIERIEATLARFGDRFRNRVFTPREQAKAEGRRDVAGTYAKRWAAKEACSKALGPGLRMGISWKDMAVSNLRSGQPVMEVTGWASERLQAMTPDGHIAVIHVTLTDDHHKCLRPGVIIGQGNVDHGDVSVRRHGLQTLRRPTCDLHHRLA